MSRTAARDDGVRGCSYLLVAAVAAGLGVVAAVTLTQHDDPAPASTRLDQARVERELTPGLVDLRANLQYSHEVSVNTGIIVSADGLVLTSNNDITPQLILIEAPRPSVPGTILRFRRTGGSRRQLVQVAVGRIQALHPRRVVSACSQRVARLLVRPAVPGTSR